MSGVLTSRGKEEAGSILEPFTGENVGDYRRWRRRAILYLQALPTTIPEKKWGARLLEHLSGEIEELMESLAIDEIVKEDGYKKVFKILDDKYKEPEKKNSKGCWKNTSIPYTSRKMKRIAILWFA